MSSPARKKRLERERRIRRDNIIKVAEQKFIEKDYDSLKIDEIALEAGYTKATIYNYFDSKIDLFAAVLAKTYQKLSEEITTQFSNSSKGKSFQTLGDAYVKFAESNPIQSNLLNSGRCTLINKNILKKIEQNKELTESEIDFKQSEEESAEIIKKVIFSSLKGSKIDSPEEMTKIVKVLGIINMAIKEVIGREKSLGNSLDNTKEILSALYQILEKGILHYND